VLQHSDTRPGDQPLYISSNNKLMRETGWAPRRSLADTFHAILNFWGHNREPLMKQRGSALQVDALVHDADLMSQGGR
jgi:hypothetical protein